MSAAMLLHRPPLPLWGQIRSLEKLLHIAKVLEDNHLRLFDRNYAVNAGQICFSNAAENFHAWLDLGHIEASTKAQYPTERHLVGHKVFRLRVSYKDLAVRLGALKGQLARERQMPRCSAVEKIRKNSAASYGFHNAFHFCGVDSLLVA
jgi:hypothetical protein